MTPFRITGKAGGVFLPVLRHFSGHGVHLRSFPCNVCPRPADYAAKLLLSSTLSTLNLAISTITLSASLRDIIFLNSFDGTVETADCPDLSPTFRLSSISFRFCCCFV